MFFGGAEHDRGGRGVSAGLLCARNSGVCARQQLAVFDCGAGAGEPYFGRAGAGDWDEREAAADWVDLRRGGDADYFSRMRLLSVGCAAADSLAAGWGAVQ